jgi:hypothetical protein
MAGEGSHRCEGLIRFLQRLLRHRAAVRAGSLLGTISHIRDPRQAAVYLGDWLRPLPPEAIVSAVDALLEGADKKDSGSDLAVQALLCPELKFSWESGKSRQVQEIARREGKFDLAAILLDLPAADSRFDSSAGTMSRDLEKVPLGRRKSLARRNDIFLMERLLSDSDRSVIANLLDNPRLTLRQVVGLASQRAASEDVLETIALHPRWTSRYQVKVTLAHNPSTPVRITLGLLRLLMSQDLKEIARDGRLSRVVRCRAEHVLRRKGTGNSGVRP